jgi:hypothetical protein
LRSNLVAESHEVGILIGAAAALYFVPRVWTYLGFASDGLDFAETEKSTTPLTAAERQQFHAELHLDDPRWILNLAIFAVFLLAAHFSRVRELKAATGSAGSQRPHSRSSMTKSEELGTS